MLLEAVLGDEEAWTPNIYLKSFDMDSVQVGKAVFVKESYTTLGIEPRTYSYPGRLVNHPSVCWVHYFEELEKARHLLSIGSPIVS